MRNLPRIAVAQPVVGRLGLVAVDDVLAEDAVLVTDSVAVEGKAERGRGVEEAGRQAAKTAVAEAGVALTLGESLELIADAPHGLRILRFRAEVGDVVR